MVESKYQKHIISEIKLPEDMQKKEPAYNRWAKHLLWLGNNVIDGAPFVNTAWYYKPEADEGLASLTTHIHDFDEVVDFFGSDPQHPYALGGEIRFCLEDQEYILKNSCLFFIPEGMRHSGAIVNIERPIYHVSFGNS
jgi:hypothetical protein